MNEVSPAAAALLILRTWPFLLLRVLVYPGVAVAFIVAAGGGAGIGWGIGVLGGPAGRAPSAFWGALGGLAFVGVMLWWLREYLLYLVEMSHSVGIAIAREGVIGPDVRGQVPQAMTALQRRFRDASELQNAARLTRLTLIDIVEANGVVIPLSRPRALPRSVLEHVIPLVSGFIAKALLARAVHRTPDSLQSPWPALRDSLALLAQKQSELKRATLYLAGGALTATAFLFLLALIPASAVAQAYPGGAGLLTLALAAVFAWAARQSLVEPFLIAAFLDLFARTADGEAPRAEDGMQLEQASAPYRQIKTQAAAARGRRPSIVA